MCEYRERRDTKFPCTDSLPKYWHQVPLTSKLRDGTWVQVPFGRPGLKSSSLPPRVCMSRNPGSGAAMGVQPRHCAMGHGTHWINAACVTSCVLGIWSQESTLWFSLSAAAPQRPSRCKRGSNASLAPQSCLPAPSSLPNPQGPRVHCQPREFPKFLLTVGFLHPLKLGIPEVNPSGGELLQRD